MHINHEHRDYAAMARFAQSHGFDAQVVQATELDSTHVTISIPYVAPDGQTGLMIETVDTPRELYIALGY